MGVDTFAGDTYPPLQAYLGPEQCAQARTWVARWAVRHEVGNEHRDLVLEMLGLRTGTSPVIPEPKR